MRKRDRERFLAWSQTIWYRERVRRASDIVRRALGEHKSIYVAFSGGKDSTALLHLVMQISPDVSVIHFDHGRNLVPARHVREIRKIARACGCNTLRIIKRKQQVVDGEYVSKDGSAQWMYRLIARLGYEAVLLGVRRQESIARRQRGAVYQMLGQVCVAPLFEWQARDVWAYIAEHNLPYLSHYDDMREKLGIDYEDIRYCTPFSVGADGIADNTALKMVTYWQEWHGDV